MRAARVGQAVSIVRSALIVAALVVAGCAETDAAPQQARQATPQQARQAAPPRTAPPPTAAPMTVRAHGLTAELPPGWQAASESLTPHLTDPREELAVGTYPLRYRHCTSAEARGPNATRTWKWRPASLKPNQ